MMVFVNSRTSRASEDETPRCEVVTLQTGPLQSRGISAETTTTSEHHVKDSFIHGEIHEVEA